MPQLTIKILLPKNCPPLDDLESETTVVFEGDDDEDADDEHEDADDEDADDEDADDEDVDDGD